METTLLDVLKYLFLGLFQGFTEPIPISSSGHLQFAQYFLGIEIDGLSFELFVNTASLLAILVIYREDLVRLTVNGVGYLRTKDIEKKDDFQFILYLIVGTIPAGVIGVLFGDVFESLSSRIYLVALSLIVTGIALFLIRNLRGKRGDGDLTLKDAIIIGLAQCVALMPGISRSGATIVAAMARGLKQETALRYSFLLFIPVSLGGTILSISDILGDPDLDSKWLLYVVAFIGSFVASYFSLKWFMGIMAKGNLIYFAIYCFIVGPIIFFLTI